MVDVRRDWPLGRVRHRKREPIRISLEPHAMHDAERPARTHPPPCRGSIRNVSTAGTLRDPNNFGKEWRTARKELGVAEVTTDSFRKTVATLIDDEGLSARIGADHLGHTHVSMTQDHYMTRGRIHSQVADMLDRTVRINDE